MSALKNYPNNLFNYKYAYIFILSMDNFLIILVTPPLWVTVANQTHRARSRRSPLNQNQAKFLNFTAIVLL